MPGRLSIYNAPHNLARAKASDALARQALTHGHPVTRLCATSSAATRTLKRLADARESLLGVEVTTIAGWARHRWSLYGDGRAFVSREQRRAAILRALATTPTTALTSQLPGVARCIESILAQGAGSPAFEHASTSNPSLSAVERDLVAVCNTYEQLLTSHGLIEPSSALAELACKLPPNGWTPLIVDDPSHLSDAELAFLSKVALHGEVMVVGCLNPNPAFEAERLAVERLATLCRAQSTPIVQGDLLNLHLNDQDTASPWRSPEVAELTQRLFAGEPHIPVTPRGDVRFCLPSGRYAEPELIAQVLQGLVKEGFSPREIAVACNAPLALAEAVAGRLAQTGERSISCRAEGTLDLVRTDLGRLITALVALVEARRERGDEAAPTLRSLASDIARNPLAGLAISDALELDCAWRGARATSPREFLADLVAASERNETAPEEGPAQSSHLARAVEALIGGDLAIAARILVEPLDDTDLVGRRERLAASAISRLAEARTTFGASDTALPGTDELDRLTGGVTVPLAWASIPPNDLAAQREARALEANPNAIEFCTLAQLGERSFEAVVLCDLTADAVSVADRANASAVFLDHLGVWRGPTALQQARHRLRNVLESARSRVVFERCLQDPEAKDLRPSALFEEVVDCYRADPCATDDLDRIAGLPKNGSLPLVTLGEERFAELASPSRWIPAMVAANAPTVFLPTEVARKQLVREDHVWSPAALELYLSCPLRWFYERQLPSQGIDASFGPRELGAFSRQVLRTFHEAMAERAQPRISGSDDRAAWEPILDACFDEALANQQESDSPLIPVTRLERERLETVRRDLRGCIERDALLPAGFIPRHHEWSFGDRETVPYGSVRLRGTVDRVDEDGTGNALVIAYKGAFGDDYGLPRAKANQDPSEIDPLPPHSQALMHATVLQRMRPGITAVGALYVSYNRARVMGFLDGSVQGLVSPEGSYLNEKSSVGRTANGGSGFQELLDYLEGEVAQAMDRLRDGDVAARPRFGKGSCAYCTVTGCPRRRTA